MKSFDEFGVENSKIVPFEECPCQNRKQLEKKEGEYIENDKSRLNRCIVGRTWVEGITMPPESITSTRRNNTKYSNREYWKIQRKRQTASWEQKSKVQEHQKNKDRYNEKTLRIEKKTEKQWGKHKERDTKERKIHRVLLPWKSGWKNLSVYMEVVYVQFLGKKWNWATGPANAEKLTVNLLHGSSSSDMSVTYSSWKCENWD